MGAEIGVGALLGAAGISAFGNLAGSALSSSGANKANEALMAFNAEEAAKNRQFQKDMYNQQLLDQQMLYNKYQSPEAIAKQLEKIGVNGSGAFAQGHSGFSGSLPSTPSVPSGSQASVGGLENPMSAYGQALKSTTSDAVSVLNAITDKNLKDKQALKVLADKANVQTQTELLAWQDMINKTIGNEKARAELNLIVEKAAMYSTSGQLNKAQTLVADTIQKLNSKEFDIKDEELSQLKLRGIFLEQSLKNEQQYQIEQIKTEKSKQAEFYASASEHRETAKTTAEIRADVKRYHKALANIEETKDFVSNNTAWNEVQQSLWQLRVSQLIPEQLEVAIERAKKDNNWYEVRVLLGMVDTGIKAYGAYKGAKTGQGFVNAQDVRNQIDKDFHDWQMNKGDKKPVKIFDSDTGEPYTIWR